MAQTIVSTYGGNSIPAGAVYTVSPATLTEGQQTPLLVDSSGNLKNREQFAPGYEDNTNNKAVVEMRYSNFNISSATTTTVKSGAGYVDEIIIAGGTLGNVTVYDNTAGSGTVLCPTVTPVSGAIILKHCTFATGLTIVTAAATVITGSYR